MRERYIYSIEIYIYIYKNVYIYILFSNVTDCRDSNSHDNILSLGKGKYSFWLKKI